MHRSLARIFVLVAVAIGSCTSTAIAQRWGATGTSAFGGSGTGAFGTSGFGNAGFGASRFGSGGFGGGGFGTSGFGNAGFGASRFGSGGFGAGGFGMGGSGFGNQSFGMGGYGGGPSFIGRDSGDMAAAFTETGRAGTQFFNQMNRNVSRPDRDRQTAQSVESVPQPMRVELQVAFAAPRPTSAAVANNLRTRLGKILADHGIAQPAVTMQGDIAVLRGVAATDNQRLVLEKLVSLEPGVRQVRNEMTVMAPPAGAMSPAD